MERLVRFVISGAVLFALGCSHNTQTHSDSTEKPLANPTARVDGGTSVVDPGTEKPAQVDPTMITPPKPPEKVKIFVHTSPPKVFVSWGKKKLGITPLTIERPRDSGPVDLILSASGYFRVHTRAYTVKNDSIGVKMTKLADKMTLFGAKADIPEPDTMGAGAPGGPANAGATPTPIAPAPLPTP